MIIVYCPAHAYLGGALGLGDFGDQEILDTGGTRGPSSSFGVSATDGGLSWRVFTGYIFDLNETVGLGPEIGYTYYKKMTENSTGSETICTNFPTCTTFVTRTRTSTMRRSAWGVDLLANLTIQPVNGFDVYLKPGIQFAHQKASLNNVFTNGRGDEVLAGVKISNEITPEIIVGGSWQPFVNKPLYIGASYQYVFKRVSDSELYSGIRTGDVPDMVSERRFASINFEYRFDKG